MKEVPDEADKAWVLAVNSAPKRVMKFVINAVSDTLPPPCQPCKVGENELGQLPSMLREAETTTFPQSLPSGPQSEVVINRARCCPQSYHDCVSRARSWRSVFHS